MTTTQDVAASERDSRGSTLATPESERFIDSPDVQELHRAIESEVFLHFEGAPAALLIASATAGEGRTTIAAVR